MSRGNPHRYGFVHPAFGAPVRGDHIASGNPSRSLLPSSRAKSGRPAWIASRSARNCAIVETPVLLVAGFCLFEGSLALLSLMAAAGRPQPKWLS